jgi:chromosome segregation ATPase
MAPSRLSEVGSVASSSHEFTRPLPVSFNSFRNESLDQARTQYLSLLESETMSARNRDGALDKKIDDLETRRVKAVQDLKTEITKLAQELSQRMSELSNMQQISADQIRYAEAGQKDAAAKAEEQFRAVDEKMESLQRSLKACKESVSRAEKASRDSAQEMAGREQNIETKVSNFAGRLTKNRDDTNKEFEAVKESIEKLKKNEVRPSKFKSVEEKVTASRVLSEETAESIRKLKASATKVTDLESKFNVQEERLDSFELSAQVMNDGLKASREDNMQHASILVDLRSTVAELQNTAASARHCVDTLESTLNDREKSMEESLEDSFRQQLDDLRTETDTKFAAQQLEYQNDVTGLIQALEEQKEMLQKQSDIISTQSAKLDRQQAVLDEYSTTIQNQNMIINMQSGGIESNDSRVKSQGRELKAQAEVIEHLKKTVPAFMKDLRLVDDKIEDYIDEQAVKEGKWTAEVSKHSCKCGTNERVHTSGKKSSKRVFSSQHRNGGRKARFVPRFRRRQHAMFAHILRIYASRALTTLTECMWQPHQLEKENN